MTPGNRAERRLKPENCARNLSRPLSRARGVGTAGVGTRWRSLTGLPLRSSSMALRPEPPMSMESVTGPAMGFLALFLAPDFALCLGEADFAGLGAIRRNCNA